MNPLNRTRPTHLVHLDREARTIRIEALQKISFASNIAREKASIVARDYQITALVEEHQHPPIMGETDNEARLAVEGNYSRQRESRFKGDWDFT